MIEPIELREYESTTVRLSDSQARRLTAAGRGAVAVSLTDEPGLYSLTAQNLVGTLVVDDLRILIRPKIRPENLFLLLEVGLAPKAWRKESFEYTTSADLLPSIVGFYARTLANTLTRGLLRSYRPEEERLVALRGRVDVASQFRQAGVPMPVACRYDEYTPDIFENRYVKAAARLAVRVPGVQAEDRRRLLQQVVALEDVSDAPVRPDGLDRLLFTRLNAHYEPALRLARLLLENLTLVDQRGNRSASSFLVDMNRLFEDFVTQRLRRALRGRLEIRSQVNFHLGVGKQVPIRPDLVFRKQGKELYVADIKYKLTADASARNSDYYQLLAYTTALDLTEGVLIYCLVDGGEPESTVAVRHADKLLHTRAINLSGPPDSVIAEVNQAADWIASQANRLNVR
ncbi:MAG: hypothetical protein OXF75_02195 [Acidimicrobiaceae bacterium]|nr:hypothetical protein [Acidimicrobiaceae bacterium]